MLRAQILTLREETQSLRQLLLIQRKVPSRALPLITEEESKTDVPSEVKNGDINLAITLKNENGNPE